MSERHDLSDVEGVTFIHPHSSIEYGPIRVAVTDATLRIDGEIYIVVAEDHSGNRFLVDHDGAVGFWDHETDELIVLASSLAEFRRHCRLPDATSVDPERVRSAWIDPTFAAELGINAPSDGWVKGGPVVPTIVGGCEVLLYSQLDSRHRPTGTCTHIVDGAEAGPATALAICVSRDGAGYYLFYCDAEFVPFTDTWHRSIEDARHQAESEYAGVNDTWRRPPD